MFTRSRHRRNASPLIDDFAVIARIEASLAWGAVERPRNNRAAPDFSRLKPFVPGLDI